MPAHLTLLGGLLRGSYEFSMEKCLLTIHLPPRSRPVRQQAKTPDQRSRLGAAAEVGPALAGAGTIP